MKRIFFFCFIVFFSIITFSQQSKIDSLLNVIKTDKEDTNKVINLYKLGFAYTGTGNYDTALFYDNAALELGKKLKFAQGVADSYNNIGVVFYYKGNYDKALENYFSSMKIKDEIGDKKGVGDLYNNIGTIYSSEKKFDKALESFISSLEIRTKINDKRGIADSYNNIGSIYFYQGNYDNALEYFHTSLKLKEELGIKGKGIAVTYNNLGSIYGIQGDYKKALESFYTSVKIKEEFKDMEGIVSCYNNIGDLFLKQNIFVEARKHLQIGLNIAKEIGAKAQIRGLYEKLSICDSSENNWKGAYEYHKLFSQYKDSSFNEESTKRLAEMQTKYETEKKEKEIELQKAQIEIKDSENKKQQYIIWSVAGGLLIMIFFSGLIFRKNKEIAKRKKEVEKAKEKIEEHQKEIIDSITYARRLQHAILPPTALIKKHFPDSFVLYNPKDIVAGDFYWMETCAPAKSGASVSGGEIVFIAAADCTGHGVPGAMVSVVCSNALNRAVKEFGLRDTGKILDKVTDLVLETFEKSASEVKDGMDISLLAYDMTSKQIQWSGANNPLWYIHNGQVVEIKADKQPVGKFDKRKSFTAHSIEHSHNSVFYLFTDGLPDQFGGPKGKKFMYKRFENNLTDISKLPMDEQQAVLEKSFQDWKGSLEQVDDVTVIGIKI